jgi:hypothetical protein
MAAIIQSATIDLATSAITIDYGTCRALEADSYTALYRAIRYRRASSRILADADDEEAEEKDQTSVESMPTGKATPSPAIKRKETSVTDTGKGVATIAAADLASGELGKFREFTFAVDPATGTARKLKVFATEGSEEEIDIPAGGSDWDGTAPSGYEWEQVNIVLDNKIVTRDILVKTSTKANVVTWSSSDSRLLLQCNTSGVLRLDKGYLKS